MLVDATVVAHLDPETLEGTTEAEVESSEESLAEKLKNKCFLAWKR